MTEHEANCIKLDHSSEEGAEEATSPPAPSLPHETLSEILSLTLALHSNPLERQKEKLRFSKVSRGWYFAAHSFTEVAVLGSGRAGLLIKQLRAQQKEAERQGRVWQPEVKKLWINTATSSRNGKAVTFRDLIGLVGENLEELDMVFERFLGLGATHRLFSSHVVEMWPKLVKVKKLGLRVDKQKVAIRELIGLMASLPLLEYLTISLDPLENSLILEPLPSRLTHLDFDTRSSPDLHTFFTALVSSSSSTLRSLRFATQLRSDNINGLIPVLTSLLPIAAQLIEFHLDVWFFSFLPPARWLPTLKDLLEKMVNLEFVSLNMGECPAEFSSGSQTAGYSKEELQALASLPKLKKAALRLYSCKTNDWSFIYDLVVKVMTLEELRMFPSPRMVRPLETFLEKLKEAADLRGIRVIVDPLPEPTRPLPKNYHQQQLARAKRELAYAQRHV